MDNPERQNNQPAIIPSQGTPLTWRALGLRILAGYVFFGVVNQIFVPVAGQWWSTAKKLVGTILIHSLQFTFVFGVTAVVALLIARIPPKNRNKPLTSFLNVALIAAILLSGVLIFGGWVARNNPLITSAVERQVPQDGQTMQRAPVIAAITTQDAKGATMSDFDQHALKNMESALVNILFEKGKNNYAELGYDPSKFNPRLNADSTFMNVGGKKLAVIKINMEDKVRSVMIIGIERSELVRVSCIRNSNHDIPVFFGECGEKIKEAFSISIEP